MKTKLLFTLFFCSLFYLTTAQVVERVAVLNTKGDASSGNFYMIAYHNVLLFNANDSIHGNELWVSDGTSAGTKMLKDINPTGDSYPYGLIEYKDKVYFSADDGVNGSQVWQTDGTDTGTKMLAIIRPQGTGPSAFRVANNLLFFSGAVSTGGRQLCVTDGTATGTKVVKNINPSGTYLSGLTDMNGKLYFSGYDDTYGSELWESDGTAAGTSRVKDIWSGSNDALNSSNQAFVVMNNKLYFEAYDTSTRSELWSSDGTTANTQLLKATKPHGYSFIENMYVFNDKIYFQADNGTHDYQLWTSDGTESGTVLLDVINPTGPAFPQEFFGYKGKVYFRATDGTPGTKIWVTDGSTAGTQVFTGASEDISLAAILGDKFYFVGFDASAGAQLWVSDGTSAGTQKILPAIAPNFSPLIHTENLVKSGNALYFGANYDSNGFQLWRVRDTTATGVQTISANALNIFPNPTTGLLNLTGLQPGDKIRVTGLLGEIVFESSAPLLSNSMQLSNAGLYFVTVSSPTGSVTRKVIVIK